MAKTDAYFQFPIHGLSLVNEHPDKVSTELKRSALLALLDHGVCHLANTKPKWKHPKNVADLAYKIWDKATLKRHRVNPEAWDQLYDPDYPRDEDYYDEAEYPPPAEWPVEMHIVLSANMLNFARMGEWPRPLEPRPFGSRTVRVRGDLMWDYFKNEQRTWREFAILCAVQTICGTHDMRRISYRELSHVALGFNGIKEFGNATANTEHQGRKEFLLTDRQVQRTVHNLKQRGLFQVETINGRHNWYSCRMSETALCERLVRKEDAKAMTSKAKTRNLKAVVEWLGKLPPEERRTYDDDPAKLRNLVAKAIGRHGTSSSREKIQPLATPALVVSPNQKEAATGSGFVFQTKSGRWHLPPHKLWEYRETYGQLDVEAELRKARQWLGDHPEQRKSEADMVSFLTGWFNRATERERKDILSGEMTWRERQDMRRQAQIEERIRLTGSAAPPRKGQG